MDNVSVSTMDSDSALANGSSSLCTSTSLVCLNFKVPLRVRQQFKIYAAQNNISMTELLLQLLEPISKSLE